MKSFNLLVVSLLLHSSFSHAVDISSTVIETSGNVNKIVVWLDKDLATCTKTINTVLNALNSANKVIVAAPKVSECNGKEDSAVFTFF